jgi:osmoprotectant transport system ATP-binding protein
LLRNCRIEQQEERSMSIKFEAVSKVYPDGTSAADAVSLRIESHEMVALVGTSGSGKTTLLRMVNRMVDPTSGRVLIDGEDIADADPVRLRRSIGYVLQGGGLLPHRTVAENVATVPILNGVRRRAARLAAGGLLERVGLSPSLAGRYPAQLSGGQQQRVGVARALAADPNILLMDEPFGAVDPIVRRELQEETRRLHRELGTTIVLVTHDVDEAFALGQRVVVLRTGGRIAQIGTPEELLTRPADAFVEEFIGTAGPSRALTLRDEGDSRLIVAPDGRLLGALAR